MNLQECRSRITETSAFAKLPQGMRAGIGMTLLWIGRTEDVEDGGELLSSDAKSVDGCVLLNGTVTVNKASGDTAEVEAPALMGEMSQLRPNQERTATVTANGPCHILVFDWPEFVEMAALLFTRDEQIVLRDTLHELALSRGLSDADDDDDDEDGGDEEDGDGDE